MLLIDLELEFGLGVGWLGQEELDLVSLLSLTAFKILAIASTTPSGHAMIVLCSSFCFRHYKDTCSF